MGGNRYKSGKGPHVKSAAKKNQNKKNREVHGINNINGPSTSHIDLAALVPESAANTSLSYGHSDNDSNVDI
ncbi:hypothetical protein HDU76_004195, partial [Blyttiomyces sp. JEL0837]